MTTVTEFKPIPIRLRPDLQWSPYSDESEAMWVAQNPVDREFYFFSELERAIALRIDGRQSLESIVQYARQLDHSVTVEFVKRLMVRLDQSSLLLYRQMRPRRVALSAPWGVSVTRLGQRLASLFAMRIPLWDPSKSIGRIEWLGKLLFHPWMMAVAVVALMAAAIGISQCSERLVRDIVSFQTTLRGDRLVVAIALLVAIKGLHEVGHALACRCMGGNSHEVGVMLLFGFPCLYCDVSDVWRVPNRWKRILVSSAGIYVEIWIALVAALIWFNTSSALVQGLSIQVLILCTVTTVMMNANPLLRYDGYYILSDWLGIPNLSDQAREAWATLWQSTWFHEPYENIGWRHIGLGLYHVMSWAYRWFLLALLFWGTNTWFFERRMTEVGGALLAVWAVTIMANLSMSFRAASFSKERTRRVRWLRVGSFIAVVATLLALGATWPLSRSVLARGIIEPAASSPLYARHIGVIEFVTGEGTAVEAGQVVARLVSPELDLEIEQLTGEILVARTRLAQLSKRSVDDSLAVQQSKECEQTIEGLSTRLERLRSEHEKLTVRSPIAGVFISADSGRMRNDLSGRPLMHRMPLERMVADRPAMERGELIGQVLDVERWQVRALVAENEIGSCQVGASARVRLDQTADRNWTGTVQSISAENLMQTPPALRGDSLFASISKPASGSSPEQVSFVVDVSLDRTDKSIAGYGLATVRIETEKQTLLEMFREWLRKSLRKQ